MSDFLFQYHAVEPTTWVYLSSLLLIGLFFKFGRLFSVRNLDLFLLIMLGPGLLMVYYGQSESSRIAEEAPDAVVEFPSQEQATGEKNVSSETPGSSVQTLVETKSEPDVSVDDADTEVVDDPTVEETSQEAAQEATEEANEEFNKWKGLEVWGFVYLFGVSALLLARLLLDSIMVRRPLLEPNLSQGGLLFIGISLFVFLMANVISEPENPQSDATDYRIARVAPASSHGPGYELLSKLPTSFSKAFCVASQLFIVVGMVLIGYWHFRSIATGIGAASLYLMLPYTSILTGRIEHVLPAATLVWAVLFYRRPLASGALIGLASGLVYYPFFLLPLWISFYWHRGFRRFVASYVGTLTILTVLLLVFSPNGLMQDLVRMFGLHAPAMSELGGIWNPEAGGLDANYRLPVLVAFIALSISMALWPAQKNLGTLLSCSAALMVAAQFWHGYGGGTYMAWYLPLMLLTVFRPNLEDRVAVSMLTDSWLPKKSSLPAAN